MMLFGRRRRHIFRARPAPGCVLCGGPILDVTHEMDRHGKPVWVVHCDCEEWEIPAAKSSERAVFLWSYGDGPNAK